MDPLVLLTPTCGRDRERFVFLRESMRRHEVGVRHIVVIDDEDDPRDFVHPDDENMEVIRVGDFLPPEIMRRARRPFRRRQARYWLGRHWVDEPRLAGWTLQQLIKLAAIRRLDSAETIACLDSDLFLLKPIGAHEFRTPDGRSRLFESPDTEAEMLGWELTAMDFLGVPRRGNRAMRHTFEPNDLDVGVGSALLDLLETRSGSAWWDAFLAAGLTEYTLYGVYAQFLAPPGSVATAEPLSLFEARNSYDATAFAAGLASGAGGAAIGMVRSALGVPVADYAPLVRSFWDEFGNR